MATINGTVGFDVLSGTSDYDNINFSQGGSDIVTASDGNDMLRGGAALDAGDHIDGGDGYDTLVLQGNYASQVTFTATTIENVEAIRLENGVGYAYRLATHDGTVAAGQTLTVDASIVSGQGSALIFDGSAETDGSFMIADSQRHDLVRGGQNDDTFQSFGGDDHLYGNGGDDFFAMYTHLTAADHVDGGAGYDTLLLDGDYSAELVLGSESLVSVEEILLNADSYPYAGYDYSLRTDDANVAAGEVLTVDGHFITAGYSLTFDGKGETDGSFHVIGGAGDDVIQGGLGNDTIETGAGNDMLSGGGGADAMTGGSGDDTYVVDNAGDQVIEAAGAAAGVDTVQSSITHTLAANVEKLTLTGIAGINGTGNALANTLIGNSGANILNGGLLGDSMQGGGGSDTYVVDSAGDVVVEAGNAGVDLVQSSVSHTLAANVEKLTLTGSAGTNATGNGLANTITGNSGVNLIDGGIGADAMAGGNGNDTYVVDNAGDQVTEAAGEGVDTVQSAVTYTLSTNVEKLTLTGSAGINGTGNSLANTLIGNSGVNTLNGGLLGDNMQGGGGNDTYVVDNAGDVAIEAANAGVDLVQSSVTHTLSANVENLTLTGTAGINGSGNALANTIVGNSNANVIDGGALADNMQGGGGNEIYIVDNAGDVVVEGASAGVDLVQSSVSFVLGANVEKLTLTGGAAVNGTGNALSNTIIGNSGINRIDGDALNDILTGGGGADDFVFDDGDGIDTVTDFQNGADQFDLTAVAGVDAFADLVLTDLGASVKVDYGTGSFTIANVADVATIDAGDFIFA